MTSQACSTAGVSRTNRRATAFSACANSVSANATTWPGGGNGTSVALFVGAVASDAIRTLDRKSTRLNSSHANISYAVFCLKKKKKKKKQYQSLTIKRQVAHIDPKR